MSFINPAALFLQHAQAPSSVPVKTDPFLEAYNAATETERNSQVRARVDHKLAAADEHASVRINAKCTDLQKNETVFFDLYSECLMEILFEEHKQAKLHSRGECQMCGTACMPSVHAPGVDIFGQKITKDAKEHVTCHVCGRLFAFQKYAPHLQNCMGLGRIRNVRRGVTDISPYVESDQSDEDGRRKKQKKQKIPSNLGPTKTKKQSDPLHKVKKTLSISPSPDAMSPPRASAAYSDSASSSSVAGHSPPLSTKVIKSSPQVKRKSKKQKYISEEIVIDDE